MTAKPTHRERRIDTAREHGGRASCAARTSPTPLLLRLLLSPLVQMRAALTARLAALTARRSRMAPLMGTLSHKVELAQRAYDDVAASERLVRRGGGR
jgi:hypothetical protein